MTRREARAILVAIRKEVVQHAELCEEQAKAAAKRERHAVAAADPQAARQWKNTGDVWIAGRNRSMIRAEALGVALDALKGAK